MDQDLTTEQERIIALKQHLDQEINIVPSEYDDKTLVVNPRQEKRGHGPEHYERQIKEFIQLFDVTNTNHRNVLVSIKNFITKNPMDKKRGEALYDRLKKYVPTEPVAFDAIYNSNILYWLLQGEGESIQQKYIKAWLGQPIEDDRELQDVDDGEYLVVTDEEADELWDENLESYIDGCMEIPEHVMEYFDRERWKEDARGDGRAHSLSGYDGKEAYQEVDGTGYYIYRTN